MLQNRDGLRIAVLVNDVASVNVDAMSLRRTSIEVNDGDVEMVELENGCVCCGPGAGELAPAVASLRDRRVDDGAPAFDHVVVELSGVADPTNVQSNLKAGGVGVDRRVALVDANSFPALYNSQAAMVDRLDLAGATELWADPCAVDVPVVGGHAGITILPLLSQTSTGQTTSPSRVTLTPTQIEHLTERVQNGGTEVVNAKAGAGSATLSMAAAAAEFAAACLRALAGHRNVTVCAYVASDAVKDVPFFATKLRLGRQGVEHNYGLPTKGLSPYEKVALDTLVPELRASIDKGVAFAGGDEAHRRRAAQQRRAAAGTAGNSDVRASGVSQIPA